MHFPPGGDLRCAGMPRAFQENLNIADAYSIADLLGFVSP